MSRDFNPFASPQTRATDRPEVVWAADNPEGLRKVKLGLTLVYAGICGKVLAALSGPIFAFTLAESFDIIYLGLAIGAVVALLNLLIIVGQCFCLAAPRESGARPLALASVVLHSVALAGSLASFVMDADGYVSTILLWLAQLANMAACVGFMLFLRQVAIYIHRYDVAGRAVRALIVGSVSELAIVAYTVTEAVSPDSMGELRMLVLIPGIGTLVGLVMYANTVTYLRRAITV